MFFTIKKRIKNLFRKRDKFVEDINIESDSIKLDEDKFVEDINIESDSIKLDEDKFVEDINIESDSIKLDEDKFVEDKYIPTIIECTENGSIIQQNGLSFNTDVVILKYKNKEIKCILKRPVIKPDRVKRHINLKSFSLSYRSLLAYKISDFLKLDFVPFTVIRDMEGANGAIIQSFVNGVDGDTGRVYLRGLGNSIKYKLFTFDYIIGNLDRNLSNVLISSKHRKIYLIDNEFTFPSGDVTNFEFTIPSVYLPDWNKPWTGSSLDNFMIKLKEMIFILEKEWVKGVNMPKEELIFLKYRLNSILKAVHMDNGFKNLFDEATFYTESKFEKQRSASRKKRQLRYGNSVTI